MNKKKLGLEINFTNEKNEKKNTILKWAEN